MSAFESKKYSWRKGYSYKVPADVVGGVLESIENKSGSVTSEKFLNESRAASSPTHDMFEWNDGIAAEKYRLEQARHIINSIELQIVSDEDIAKPAFINVEVKATAKTAVYKNIECAFNNEEQKRNILLNALNELRSFERKYSSLKELSEVFSAIDSFGESLEV